MVVSIRQRRVSRHEGEIESVSHHEVVPNETRPFFVGDFVMNKEPDEDNVGLPFSPRRNLSPMSSRACTVNPHAVPVLRVESDAGLDSRQVIHRCLPFSFVFKELDILRLLFQQSDECCKIRFHGFRESGAVTGCLGVDPVEYRPRHRLDNNTLFFERLFVLPVEDVQHNRPCEAHAESQAFRVTVVDPKRVQNLWCVCLIQVI